MSGAPPETSPIRVGDVVPSLDDLLRSELGSPDKVAEEKKPSQATALRKLAMDRYEFGVGQDGTPFALSKKGPRIPRPFRGGRTGLKPELSALFAKETGITANSSALADALTALEGVALATEPQVLAIRVAEHDGSILLDLGRTDGHVVQVTASGYQVLKESPILFRRTALTGALPDPAPSGGSFDPLRQRLNVAEEDWPLVQAWLVSALMSSMPHPVLSLLGEQGTGKSTATELLVTVIDPSPAPLRAVPRDVEQWAVAASASWVVGLDNVSGMQPWFSDVLCRAVTGDGLIRRMLYSDGDVSVLSFRRCIVTNGIDYGTVRGDLADRMLSVGLTRITTSKRRTAAAVAMTESQRAVVLGALCQLTSDVLAILPGIHLDEMPRMADFARVVAAVDKILSTEALKRYTSQAADLAAAVVDADPFAAAVVELIGKAGSQHWTGPGQALHAAVTVPDPRPRSWPADGQRTNAALRRVAPALRAASNLSIEESKDPKTRQVTWTIKQMRPAEEPSQPSQASKVPLTRGDAPKPGQLPGFGAEESAFAPGESAKPAKAGHHPAKADHAPGFAGEQASDLHEYVASKPAKAAKPAEQHKSDCTVCQLPINPAATTRGQTTHATCGEK